MDLKKIAVGVGALGLGGIIGNAVGKAKERKLKKKIIQVAEVKEEMEVVFCLFMENCENGVTIDYDVFGVYSTREKAEEAKQWRKREDGLYQGVRPDLVYNYCAVLTRFVDCNLPREEP